MGGTKKKSISQAEKAQEVVTKKTDKKGKEQKGKTVASVQSLVAGKVDEKQAMKMLAPIRAITAYAAAKTLGLNVSVASSLLRSLESKGVVKRVGGFSGHFVYSVLAQPSDS